MRARSILAPIVIAVALVGLPIADAGATSASGHKVVTGACGLDLRGGYSHCNLSVIGLANGRLAAASTPTGYGPADLRSAYALSSAGGSGQTVAIVDAYDDKSAEADLATYRSFYGLPACTTANGCFKKVNQTGLAKSYPSNNVGWATEISLDLDMVSAICPNCHILLVEAKSNSNANLYASVDEAAKLGATEISNSYGGAESTADAANNVHYNHPGIAITVSAGDSGYGVEFPAASPYVTAVGGTTLTRSGSGFTESAWSGTGSGCSKYEAKPAWQADAGCAKRSVVDVSAVADPNTGVSVYDSNCNALQQLLGNCFTGWGTVGGTSASSPIIAGVYALAGNAKTVNYGSAPYASPAQLHDVTSGSNGSCGTYLCNAGPGYDGPTGLGTPNSTGAF